MILINVIIYIKIVMTRFYFK